MSNENWFERIPFLANSLQLRIVNGQGLQYKDFLRRDQASSAGRVVDLFVIAGAGNRWIGEGLSMSKEEEIRIAVLENYRKVAVSKTSGCGCSTSSCCQNQDERASSALGYSANDLAVVPEGADMGLGCGNPQAIAALKSGETVLDLGCGGGFDCFLASRAVGDQGLVIGVDMTPEMIVQARSNAEKNGYTNVSFRLGELEHLPVADGIIDVIISNCVINLSPEKEKVFREAWRVLKPGGRLAVSDIVAFAEMPDDIKKDLAAYACCVAGASPIRELERLLAKAGFEKIRIVPREESKTFIRNWLPGRGAENYVVSANLEAVKP